MNSMYLFGGIIFFFVLFFYFYSRLPSGNPVKTWIDGNTITIGNIFVLFWIVFLFTKDTKLGFFYAPPLLLLAIWANNRKRKGQDDEDNQE